MIQTRDANGTPMMITPGALSAPLTRVMLGTGTHNEAWLQALIFNHPEMLPIGSIEPAFSDAVAIACEIPCSHGYIDNLYLTPRGDIVVVEVKLWKNPQARREMVAQVLDYVAALMTMDYSTFEQALRQAKPTLVAGSLWKVFEDHPDALPEAAFIDAVSGNLQRGRLLALAVGDGVRAEAHALASLLQSHAGAHFSLALVELGLWQDGVSDRWLCVPKTLLQTVLVERGIVSVENAVARITPVPIATAAAKPHTISDSLFLEGLATIDSTLPSAITAFMSAVAPLGLIMDQKASLMIKADVGGDKLVNLGTISKTGQLWTDYLNASVPIDLATRYNQQLALLIGGMVADGPLPRLVTQSGSAPPLSALLPRHQNDWIAVINELIASLRAAQEAHA